MVLAVALLVCCVMAFGTDEEAQKPANQTLTEQTIEQKKEDKSTVERVFHRFDTWKSRINKFLAHKDVAPKDVDLDKDAQVAHANIAMGLALLLVTQALFNMCVAVGLVPVTGQPLPFISKGGTATIINCVYIGAILSVSRSAQRKQEIIADTDVA